MRGVPRQTAFGTLPRVPGPVVFLISNLSAGGTLAALIPAVEAEATF